jgi:SAM-dependent methyltransferase
MSTAEPKPSHLSGEYGAWFKDPLLVAAYPARPAYPAGVIEHLAQLIADEPRVVLDVGCGTGELARRLAPKVERVDAVDFSAGMLELGRRLAGDSAGNVNWILGAVEEVELSGPYALITAGESLHWMNWEGVMPRFASILAPNGVLAIAGRSWDTDPAVTQREVPIIERYSPVKDYRPYDLVDGLRQRGLFDVAGEQRFGPAQWRPTIDEYLECRHSQRGLSRTHMGEAAVTAFDAEVREAFEELCASGVLARHDGRLELKVVARVTWGRPRPFSGV